LRGSQVLIRELAEGLAEAGHAVHVVTYPTAEHLVAVKRIAIHRVPKVPGLWTTRPLGWQKIVLDCWLLWRLYQVVREQDIQVIHAHNLEGPLLGYMVRWLTGVPVVYHAHNALSDELPCYARTRLMKRVLRVIGVGLDHCVAAAADSSIALTDRLAAFLAARGAAGRVTVVPPGVRPLRAIERPGPRRNSGPIIMYAGNLDPYQDLRVLLDGFDRVRAVVPQARLVFMTHAAAPRRRRTCLVDAAPGVSVRVVPTFAAVLDALRDADVVVCPRGTWSGFPIKVLNYMALGRPIVHAQASAHPIEDENTGLVFPDNDARALAQRIVRVLRDTDLAQRMGRQARMVAREQYNWARVLPAVIGVYRRVLASRPRATFEGGCPMNNASVEPGAPNRSGRPQRTYGTRMHAWATLALCGVMVALMACGSRRDEHLAPLPPVSANTVAGQPEVNALYLIQAYDSLRVRFVYHPDLDTKVPVRPDGGINITGVGEFQAAGKTTQQLAREIEKVSSERLREPEVEVIVAELGRYNVWVFGEVRQPGQVPFRIGMTPIQVISDRGGFTDYARADSVLRIRPEGTATRVDLTGNLPDTITEVEANEVIYVPRTFVGDAVAFVRTFRNLLPVQPRFGFGYSFE
jgi:glycosyltransferase involved in cell wall biosynthesis/protein involved in polysaccharide export with SLBB domain